MIAIDIKSAAIGGGYTAEAAFEGIIEVQLQEQDGIDLLAAAGEIGGQEFGLLLICLLYTSRTASMRNGSLK